ncbi:MAG: hypothetical protein QXO03_03005 [Thermoplasmatales archaeon]
MMEIYSKGKLSPHLLYRNADFDFEQELPPEHVEMFADIGINIIVESMARGDKKIKDACEKVLFRGITDLKEIRYRQEVVRDALDNTDTVRRIFSMLNDAVDKARKQLFWLGSSNPEYSLHESVSIMKLYVSVLEDLRKAAETSYNSFTSEGFRNLFSQIINEFNDGYISKVKENLSRLEFPYGVKVIGKLSRDCEPTELKLVKPELRHRRGLNLARLGERKLTYVLPERDESGFQELANIRNKSLMPVTVALKYASENLLNFINGLISEFAFLIGCINLHEDIGKIGASTVFPDPKPQDENALGFEGLYDISLLIKLGGNVVSNSLPFGNQKLIMITGANRGGKSTFLRSVGQSLIMMKAGIYVAANGYTASTFSNIQTHFKREEEKEMTMGKLDEELDRMDKILNRLSNGSVVLFNESFAATNAIEASQIAKEIITGLVENGVRIIFVTHLYELASLFLDKPHEYVRFLVAERLESGERTFRIIGGIPTATSYAEDLFKNIFKPGGEGGTNPSQSRESDQGD